MTEMAGRRDFLRTLIAAGSLFALESLLHGCSPAPLAYAHEMFQSRPYPIEKALREERLAVNTGHNLRRYQALPGDPYTREMELVSLARKEKIEESFVYVQPESVWYEVGIQFKNDKSIPSHDDGHKHDDAIDEEFSSRTLDNLIHIFSGELRNIPKANTINFYHFHPVYLRAKNVYFLGEKRRRQLGVYNGLEEWAYMSCIKPSPPSLGDLQIAEIMERRARFEKMNYVERVADHSGIWEFRLNKEILKPLDKLHFTKFLEAYRRLNATIESADRRMIFSDKDYTPEDYIALLKSALRSEGFTGEEVQIKYRPIGMPFRPSREEFRAFLRKHKMI